MVEELGTTLKRYKGNLERDPLRPQLNHDEPSWDLNASGLQADYLRFNLQPKNGMNYIPWLALLSLDSTVKRMHNIV